MNSNFTPGPWHVKDNGLIYILPPDKSGNLVVAGCGQTYRVSDWEKERSLANASLIAAAPEMYHDLHEAVVEMCEHCDSYVSMKCKKEDGKCFVQRWIKTLKKARGEK